MEWEFEVNDLIWFSESSENPFRFLVKFAEGLDDPYRRRKYAISYVDANKAFEKYITDFGFCSREEIEALSEEQSRSVLVTTENLHGAASRALKVTDFVSGLDLGELQERLVETFLVCLDQDWNYVIGQFQYIATFEALLKVFLRDSPRMSWLKWQFDLTGSSVEIAQVPEVSYEDNISVVHVNPEYDIMMSVSHTALGLEDQDQCIAETKYPGYYFVKVPSFSDDSEEDLLKITTFRNSKCYLSAAKFRSEIYQIIYDLKMFSDVVDNKTPGNEDFEMKVAPHGPAVQIDEHLRMESGCHHHLTWFLQLSLPAGQNAARNGWKEKELGLRRIWCKKLSREAFILCQRHLKEAMKNLSGASLSPQLREN